MTWSNYYQHNQHRAPSALLLEAVPAVHSKGRQAIDLGCGGGIDTQALLDRQWDVLAIDRNAQAIERVLALARASAPGGVLTTRCEAFEALTALPPADLVFAGLSLPFCAPAHFLRLWQKVLQALRPGAVFAGHLLGPHDAWADQPGMCFVSRSECLDLFNTLELQQLQEVDAVGPSMRGPKHWHKFEFVARKPCGPGAAALSC